MAYNYFHKYYTTRIDLKKALTVILSVIIILAMFPLSASAIEIGEPVPDFTIVSTDGESITLSESLEKYKAVVLNFWFIGCSWCDYEFPFLEEYYQLAKEDVLIIALSPYDTQSDIADYKADMGLSFPMAFDETVINHFDVVGYPTTIVIDRTGVCREFEAGAQSSKESFEHMISPYIVSSPDAPAETITDAQEGTYTIKFVDKNGTPVSGITAQICSDSVCNVLQVDENGIFVFDGPIYAYELHVLRIPDGYSYDMDSVVILNKGSNEYTVTLVKLNEPSTPPSSTVAPEVPDNEIKSSATVPIIAIAIIVVAAAICVWVFKTKKH